MIQFDVKNMGHWRCRPAPRRGRQAGPRWPRADAARCAAQRPPRPGDATPVLAFARARPRRSPGTRSRRRTGSSSRRAGSRAGRAPARAWRSDPRVRHRRRRARRRPPAHREFDLRPGVPDLAVVPAGRRGSLQRDAHSATRRSTRSATATRVAASSCAARSPSTSPAPAASPRRRNGSSSAPASSRAYTWSGPRWTRPWAVEEYGHAAHRRGLDAAPIRSTTTAPSSSELGVGRRGASHAGAPVPARFDAVPAATP